MRKVQLSRVAQFIQAKTDTKIQPEGCVDLSVCPKAAEGPTTRVLQDMVEVHQGTSEVPIDRSSPEGRCAEAIWDQVLGQAHEMLHQAAATGGGVAASLGSANLLRFSRVEETENGFVVADITHLNPKPNQVGTFYGDLYSNEGYICLDAAKLS